LSATVTIVIPNWNGRHLLEGCLASVAAQTARDFEVVLVDNGSNDDSLGYVRAAFPWVRVLENGRNLGFAAAVNQAIRATSAPYIAILNNDVQLDADWLAEVLGAIAGREGVGAVASKLLVAAAPSLIDAAGIALDRAGFAWNLRRGELDDPAEREPREVFGACAAAALYRREMLEAVGLFDEDFFAFLEDADLAWRARLAGWHCLYVPTARAYHIHSATAGRDLSRKAYLLARNRLWAIAKDYPMPDLLLYLPAILLWEGASFVGNLAAGTGGPSFRGRWDALRHLGVALSKRRSVQGLKKPGWRRGYRLHTLSSPWRRWSAERRLRAILSAGASGGGGGPGYSSLAG
jgi:hypothetical protein